jgi:hypothetical protein
MNVEMRAKFQSAVPPAVSESRIGVSIAMA